MPISFRCSKCSRQYKVSSKLAGKRMLCKGCESKIRIPNPFAEVKGIDANEPTANHPPPPSATLPTGPPQPPVRQMVPIPPTPVARQPEEEPIELGADDMVVDDFIPIQSEWVVICDDCHREHRPDESLMGKRIRCKCGTILHLTENAKATIPLAKENKIEDSLPELVPVPVRTPGQQFQAPPPVLAKESAAERYEEDRRREAEQMVRNAGRKEAWERRRAEQNAAYFDDDEEWGPLGKIIGGGALVAAGVIVGLIAWQAGYIVGVSFWLIGIGTLSIIYGLVESIASG